MTAGVGRRRQLSGRRADEHGGRYTWIVRQAYARSIEGIREVHRVAGAQ